MAYTAGFSVSVGDPTKASDVSVLAANDDFLKTAIDKIMVDSATPTFALVDGVTATTQSSGNNSTKLATTAYADAATISFANDANNRVVTGTGSGLNGEANLTFDGTDLAIGNTAPSSYINSVHGVVVGESDDATSEIVIAGTVGELNFTDTADTTNQASISHSHSTNELTYDCISGMHEFSFNGAVNARIDQAKLFMYEDANAFQSIGATLNQATADDEILTLKSSDVAHGMTSLTETDTYGTLSKRAATAGILQVKGYGEGVLGLTLYGVGSVSDTTKGTAGEGAIEMKSGLKSGTSAGDLGTDGNMVVMRTNGGTTRFIFDQEGTGHADVAWTTYDTYDDLATITEMEDVLLANESPDQTPRRHAMEATGIIGKDSWHMEDGKPRAMVNFTKLAMLHHGALIQTGDRFKMLEDRLEATEAKLLLAQSKLDKLEIN